MATLFYVSILKSFQGRHQEFIPREGGLTTFKAPSIAFIPLAFPSGDVSTFNLLNRIELCIANT